MKYGLISAVSLLMMVCTLPAWSDTEMNIQSNQDGAPASMYISSGKVYTAAEGHKIIIDPYQETMTIMNEDKKEYMEIDEAFIGEISGMMNMMQGIMSQLPPGMLDQLPPEQREQILAQLGGGDSKKEDVVKAKAVVKKTGSNKKVSGIACENYTITDAKGSKTQACVASRSDSKMNKEDFETLMQVSEFGMAFVEKMSAAMPNIVDDIDISAMTNLDLPGVPMEVINDDTITSITSITEKSIDLSGFDISKYKQIDISQMMGQ